MTTWTETQRDHAVVAATQKRQAGQRRDDAAGTTTAPVKTAA